MTGFSQPEASPTRSHSGARRHLRAWWAALVVLACAAVGFTGSARALDPDGDPGPLPWRVGGALAFTVDAAAIPDSAGGMLEVGVRIPPRTLARLADDEAGGSKLRVSLKLKTRYGGKQHEAAQEITVAPFDTGGAYGKVVIQRFPAKPGSYRLEARLEDLLSRKKGLVYMGRAVTQNVKVEGAVKIEPAASEIEVSNPTFVWTGSADPRPGTAGGSLGLPNPERLYGLFASTAQVAFVARATGDASRAWHWRMRLLDAGGVVVAQRDSTEDPSPIVRELVTLDVSAVPAGAYTLELQVARDGKPPVVRKATMDVAWQLGSWNRDPDDIADEVHFLYEPKDEEAFASMGPGAREASLARFWKERDPDPETGENEARTAYLARVEHANRTWSQMGKVKGMYSDMGRVYIRYGEPDEILRQVLPAGDQTLMHVLQSLDLTETRPTGEVESKGIGGDQRPFEIWNYDMGINRSLTAARNEVLNEHQRRRLVFLFVDEHGYGDYRLRYSTE